VTLLNYDGLEYDTGFTAPGNFLIGFMVKYYTDKKNPDFWDAREKQQNTIKPRSYIHLRFDLWTRRIEARYNFKTNRKSLKEVLL